MTSRFAPLAAPFLLLLAAAAPAPDAASPPPPPPSPKPAPTPAPAPPGMVRVAIETEMGTITLDLDTRHAPITSANFLRYADEKRFDGTVFYRAMRLDWGTQPNGLIQGGTRGDPKRVLPPIKHEPTNVTGILHKAGTISMARFAPGTATGDFSILLSDLPALNADAGASNADAAAGFAAFGHVVAGMDVVRKIFDAPLSPTKGEGVLKGQMLDPSVRILTVHRVAVPDQRPANAPGRQREGR